MGGLVAVVGRPDAADRVRRAARPLLRRPWQGLRLAATEDREVALGFAGERGGVAVDETSGALVALDGELLTDRGVMTGDAAADVMLLAFLRRGADLDPPEGNFAAACWDPSREELTVLTDRLGRRPVYVARHREALLLAGELKGLLAAGLEPELDVQAAAELLAYEQVFAERTLLAGVRLLRGATTATFAPDGSERLRERWRYRLEPAERADDRELAEEFARLLEEAVVRRLDDATALSLSGGLDSRCVATILMRLAPDTPLLTYGAPGSDDLRYGAEVAVRTGLPYRVAPFEPGYIARGAAEAVWLSEGSIRAFHCHHFAVRSLRAVEGRRGVIVAYGGDHLLRWVSGLSGDGPFDAASVHRMRNRHLKDELVDELLTPAFADALRGRASAALAEQLGREEGEPLARVRQLLFDAQRRKIWPGAELFADDLASRDPYDDRDLMELGRRLPEALRRGGRLQRLYLDRFPALAAVPNTKDSLPPGVDGVRRSVRAFRVRAQRSGRFHLDRALGPGWWRWTQGLGDYSADLRSAGADLLGTLLEPRTLERGQLREEGVRRLVEGTLAGRARNTMVLGMLLTLELFQRQFVDGDGLALEQAPAELVA